MYKMPMSAKDARLSGKLCKMQHFIKRYKEIERYKKNRKETQANMSKEKTNTLQHV